MRAEEIHRHVLKQPFEPFRVHVSDGSSYDVQYRKLIVVARTSVFIGFAPHPGAIPNRTVLIDPIHVTRIEPLNGGTARRRPRRR